MSAQEFRGAISGAVTDATGGTIAGAKITVTETRTNTRLNDTDPRPEKRIGVFDHTHRGVITLTYALPVRKRRALGIQSRWLNAIVGGRQLNTIYTKQSGQPFTWMGTSATTIGDLVYFGEELNFNPRDQRPGV